MARMVSIAKTSRVNRTTPFSPSDVSEYCRDLENWPRSWMGWEKDLPPGERLVACFCPFIAHLASSGLSRKTIRRHVDNLWMLGGVVIRDLHETPSQRKLPAERLLWNVTDDDGGPLIHHGDSEEQQRSFDATCRKLRRFLSQSPR